MFFNFIGSKSCDTEDSIGVQATSEALADIKLTFNSSLSYADRLMLKKHRKNPESTVSYSRPRNKESTKSPVVSKAPKSNSGPVSPRISNSPPKSIKQNGKRQNSSSCQKKTLTSSENNYPSVLQIQLLPSDEDDSKYGSSDSSSPIVNYTIDEGPTARTDRRTLSQMGRLAIVELSFSDPENDVSKSKDSSCSPALTNHSSLSFKRAPSGVKSPSNDPVNAGTAHFPHPPNAPSNTYVARQKILLEKKKKSNNGQVSSATNSKKTSKRIERKWQPSNKYVGLSSFFMAGVEKENLDGVNPNDERSPSHANEETAYPLVGLQLADSWRQESSLSQIGGTNNGNTTLNSSANNSNVRHRDGVAKSDKGFDSENSEQKSLPSTEASVCRSQNITTPKIVTTKSTLASPNNADTPRVSMTDFDFLSALPPASKGDDLLKLHRASTVTLFALSPQPPDVWNDDSEIEIPSAVQISQNGKEVNLRDSSLDNKSTLSESDRKEIDKEDTLALEALSKEITESHFKNVNKSHPRGTDWEDDSLSIEDNDDGSGLTSSADGEESDDPDSKDFDQM